MASTPLALPVWEISAFWVTTSGTPLRVAQGLAPLDAHLYLPCQSSLELYIGSVYLYSHFVAFYSHLPVHREVCYKPLLRSTASLIFYKLYLKRAGVDEGKIYTVFGVFAVPRSPFQVLVMQISCFVLAGKVLEQPPTTEASRRLACRNPGLYAYIIDITISCLIFLSVWLLQPCWGFRPCFLSLFLSCLLIVPPQLFMSLVDVWIVCLLRFSLGFFPLARVFWVWVCLDPCLGL